MTSASLERTLSWRDVELFAVMSGDINPAHVDEEYARSDRFHGIVAHGMWGAALISTLLGTRLPGPGTIYLERTLCFRHPITIGDTISVSVAIASKDQTRHGVAPRARRGFAMGPPAPGDCVVLRSARVGAGG